MAKKVQICMTLDGDLVDQLKAEAGLERRSVSALVEIFLEEALAVHQSLREKKPEGQPSQ